MEAYEWPARDEFRNRVEDLAAIERWWRSRSRDLLALTGRRRVGKSWLFRRFADGKPALILVADRRLPSVQLAVFAERLETTFGVRPDLPDLAALFRAVFRYGRDRRILFVIDEFPYLLPEGAARQEVLSQVQAVIEEERDRSKAKIILCGSMIGQMEALLAGDSPLHGRLQSLDVRPLGFAQGAALRETGEPADRQIERYAIAGGMARHLDELGQGSLRERICELVLDPRGPLFDDPRAVLEQELRSPASYMSILTEIARRPVRTERLTDALGMRASALWPLINVLQQMRLVRSMLPVGAPSGARSTRHEITDGFYRFWFRFVFPNQAALEDELRPADLWEAVIEPALADFVAPTFEDLCRRFVRRSSGATAPIVGAWWGKALNSRRRAKTRLTEEIDVVAARGSRVQLVGECKWTSRPMPLQVLVDLLDHKLPALAEEGRLELPPKGPSIMLFSRSGFSSALRARVAGEASGAVRLIEPEELVRGLLDERPK